MGSKAKLGFVTFLTFVRFPLVLLFFAAAVVYNGYESPEQPLTWLFVVTFAALILSALTDLFDGYYARKFEVTTSFGAHADPLMDKFFYLASLPLLVFVALHNGNTRHAVFLLVLTLLFLARDQWVTFLRSIGSLYNVSGGAMWSGKVRTAVNFPLICGIYYFEEAPDAIQFIPTPVIYVAEWIAILITIYTLFTYTRHYWPSIRRASGLGSDTQASSPESDTDTKTPVLQPEKAESLVRMARGIAHDAHNHLAAVLGNNSIVMKVLPEDSPAMPHVQEVEENAMRTVDLIDELRTYAGGESFNLADTHLCEVLHDTIKAVREEIPQKVEIACNLGSDSPTITGDRAAISKVFRTLIINATEAMPEREGKITVTAGIRECDQAYLDESCCTETMDEGTYAFVEVADNGMGIPGKLKSKLFDPFFTTKIRGHGMGLPIALGIMRSHGGTIHIATEKKVGSRFTVLFPLS